MNDTAIRRLAFPATDEEKAEMFRAYRVNASDRMRRIYGAGPVGRCAGSAGTSAGINPGRTGTSSAGCTA